MNPSIILDKFNNTKKIIDLIIKNGAISRHMLADLTGLSSGTITNIVKDLLAKDLIRETGNYTSSHGRKARIIEFNDLYGYIVGIEIQAFLPSEIYLTNLAGKVIDKEDMKINVYISREYTEEDFVNDLVRSIGKFIAKNDKYASLIHAIGIAIPAIANLDDTVYAPLLNWNCLPLRSGLQSNINIPVYIENVTRIRSTYELSFVDEKDKNVLYLALDQGIGMVNFFGGKMIKGRHAFAGEVGHMSLNIDGPKCYCGNSGCFEMYCGLDSIVRQAKELLESGCSPILMEIIGKDYDNLDLVTLAKAQESGDMKVHALLMDVGKHLGCALSNLINCFDPDSLIISSDLIDETPIVYAKALEEMRKRTMDVYFRETTIIKARLKHKDIVKAIAVFLLDKILERIIETSEPII